MPKVRILSGNDAGAVVDMPTTEAECAIATGFAAEYAEPISAPRLAPKQPKPEEPKPPAPVEKKRGR